MPERQFIPAESNNKVDGWRDVKLEPPPPPPESFENRVLEMETGDGGDDDRIKQLRALIGEYKNFSNREKDKGVGDKNKIPDFRALPVPEKIQNMLEIIGKMDKPLKDSEAILAELKQGNVEGLDALLNPRETPGPTEL